MISCDLARQPAGWPVARTPLARTSPQPALFSARATPRVSSACKESMHGLFIIVGTWAPIQPSFGGSTGN